MQCVIRPLARAAAVLVAGPFLAFASAFAPLHVHEPGHDHEQAVAHSHFAPHAEEPHHSGADEIEHDGAGVVWLDGSILNEFTYQAFPVPAVATQISVRVVVERSWSSIPAEDIAPAHGPPKRAHLFRGPPLTCLS